MDKSEPWFADICNFLVASMFPPKASKSYKDKNESDAKGGHYGSSWTTRKVLDCGSISSPFSEMLTNMSRPANSVSE
ncbi:hypothetical protein CR513_08136, partial [Mucuna pruriens]